MSHGALITHFMHSKNISCILKQESLSGLSYVCQLYPCRNQITQRDILLYLYTVCTWTKFMQCIMFLCPAYSGKCNYVPIGKWIVVESGNISGEKRANIKGDIGKLLLTVFAGLCRQAKQFKLYLHIYSVWSPWHYLAAGDSDCLVSSFQSVLSCLLIPQDTVGTTDASFSP